MEFKGAKSVVVHKEEEEEILEPTTPTGQYFNSEALNLGVLAVLELEIPIDDSPTMSLLKHLFLPINHRFSSIMVKDEQGRKQWKKVSVNLEDHVEIPVYPDGLPPESYDKYFQEYLEEIAMEQLPQTKPLWKLHIFKYPTRNAAGVVVFKLHQALGDGFSLMGALFTCLKRADNPSLPLTFPSLRFRSNDSSNNKKISSSLLGIVNVVVNTVMDFTWSLMKSNVLEDDVSPIRSGNEYVEMKPVSISNVTFSLDQLKQIKTKLNGTINDVICGIIFYGTRLYMETASEGSGKARSTALIVFNTREMISYQTVKEMFKPDTKGPWGNNLGLVHVAIPESAKVELADPLEFVNEAKKLMTKKKSSLGVYLTSHLIELMRKLRGSEVTSANGNTFHSGDHVESGHFAFTAAETGDYMACFWSPEQKEPVTITVDFNWKMGYAAKDWPNVAKKGQVDYMEQELKKLEDTVRSIHEEMFNLREREEEMQELNKTTTTRMTWLSFLSLFICLSVAGLQLWHLKSFFEKKKLI